MHSDDKFWSIVCVSCVVCIIVIVVSSIIYCDAKNNKIKEMTISGADPVACAIALDNIYDDHAKTYFLSKRIAE